MSTFSTASSASSPPPSHEAPQRLHYGTKTYPSTYFSNTKASMAVDAEAPESPSFDLDLRTSDFETSFDSTGPPPVKKLKLVLSSMPKQAEDPHETPAMRQKMRPKRPTLNLVVTPSTGDQDSDDEDYIAPRTVTSQFQANRRANSTQTPPPSSISPSDSTRANLDGAYRYPTNAYSDIGTSRKSSQVTAAIGEEPSILISIVISSADHILLFEIHFPIFHPIFCSASPTDHNII